MTSQMTKGTFVCVCGGTKRSGTNSIFRLSFPRSDDEANQKYIAEAARDQDKKVHEPE